MSKREPLGEGLDALFRGMAGAPDGDSGSSSRSSSQDEDSLRVVVVPIAAITPSEKQPRTHFAKEKLEELASSIEAKGILQPILVREDGEHYRIVAGERRYRAARIAKLDKIPVMIQQLDDLGQFEVALIENIQREDLDPLEEALAYKELMERGDLSQEQVAERVGKKRSTVANSLRLLRLEGEIRDSLVIGAITPGHARAILSLKTPEERLLLHNKIIGGGLSVRDSERLAGKISGDRRGRSPAGDTNRIRKQTEFEEIEQELIELFGTKVAIKGSTNGGKIEISFFSTEDLERILGILSLS